jgi:AraC family transcriptional regulator of adaptative response / DNA-3-methyladenine glycosylase II
MDNAFSNARIRKDRTFDGTFYFGVKTTGIFCKPSCPSPVAEEENVVYFRTVFEALNQGFRPCLRCRPDISLEYHTGNADGVYVVDTALGMIYDGYLNDHSIRELSRELLVSDRHLRKLFMDHVGVSPVKIAKYHRALFSKKLLLFSNQSVTDVAFASGFGSIRHFNHVFKETFGKTPTRLRNALLNEEHNFDGALLLLKYKKPFDFKQILSFMRLRAIKGVEVFTENSFSRTFRTDHASGFFTVTDNPQKSALELKIGCDDIRCYMDIYYKIRKVFDLDTDFEPINHRFAEDNLLRKGMLKGGVPRLPVAFDPFEFVVRAVVGQQISVKAATTVTARIAERAALKTGNDFPLGLDYFFPDPSELLPLSLDGLGLSKTRQATLKTVADAVLNKAVKLTAHQSFDQFHKDFSALKGIGDWTVNYVAMRGLGMVDAFPAGDLGVIKALTKEGKAPSEKEAAEMAEQWRPYRTYAALCLWNLK